MPRRERIGALAEGYICPPEQRALRDLLRKRSRLVQQRTANLLSLQGIVRRNTGQRFSASVLKSLELGELLEAPNVGLAAESTRRVMQCLDGEVKRLEQEALRQIKAKGRGNRKNGNPYLAWAWIEAAFGALRHHAPVRRFYERKKARTHQVVARKAVAHKLARAGYYVMRDRVPFQIDLAFG